MRPVLAAAVLATALSPRAARAGDATRPPVPEKARELADRGRAYHDAGQYRRAITAFEEAYVIAPSPGLLFNLAQAYRLSGNCDDAAWMYHRYLETNPDADRRALAERNLEAVEKCGHGSWRVALAPRSAGHGGAAKPAAPDVVAAGAAVAPGAHERRIGVGLAIGGGIALAGAAAFAIDASAAADEVGRHYEKGGAWSGIAGADARGRRDDAFAKLLGIGGGLALASGAAFYLVGWHREHPRRVLLVPRAGGAEVRASWTF